MSIEKLITDLSPKAGKAYALVFERAMIAAGMETDVEKAHFLAQVMHESCGFTVFVENLNYSAERLVKVFPKYFTKESAARYHRNPIAIGSRVYANRMGNGNEASGEGYKYRGHGAIQITGRNNMRSYSIYKYGDMRITNNPKLLTEPIDAADSAIWFWVVNGCKRHALKDDIVAVSGIVNVGRATAPASTINGLVDRVHWLNKIKQAQAGLVHGR